MQLLYDIAEICNQKGITRAILCPGSRCAPLTLAFVRHPHIKTFSISDERSAAFIACGMSGNDGIPTVLICTSGSAVYNFSPAVAESFYQHIPLLIITADRPHEWIDQQDGQTIRQQNIYGHHVKKYYEFPQERHHKDIAWHAHRIVNEAINISLCQPLGPVHINVPVREPLYPPKKTPVQYNHTLKIIKHNISYKLSKKERTIIENLRSKPKKILIVVGQTDAHAKLTRVLEKCSRDFHIPIIADVTANQHAINNRITQADIILDKKKTPQIRKALQSELLITIGKSIISKNVKQFIREYRPTMHWHVQEGGMCIADTYQSLTHIFSVNPLQFIKVLIDQLKKTQKTINQQKKYYIQWIKWENKIRKLLDVFISESAFSELHAVHQILQRLPKVCNLHLSNSLPIRHANMLGYKIPLKQSIRISSNRGVNGIDGCSSTAVGHTLNSKKITILLTGDMAFFYDRNAFWHNYAMPHLRIIVLNNHGAAIFKTINGTSQLSKAEQEKYFVTQQPLIAKNLAEEYFFDYHQVTNYATLKVIFDDFMKFTGKTKILEIETKQHTTAKTMSQLQLLIKKYES